MRIIFLDFETYYDKEYSLRKITPVEYVLDARFECQGCAIKDGLSGIAYWLDGPDLPAFFASLDPNDTMLVTHNALFDMCIVAWIFNFVPRLMVDTMGVAKAVLGHILRRVSLDSVGVHLGIGKKGNTLAKVIGMRLADIKANPHLYKEFVEYALTDVDICAGIFHRLVKSGIFPTREIVMMDIILRCAIEPKFVLDQELLYDHYGKIVTEKQNLLAQAMLLGADGKTDLASNERFAELLRQYGVEPPTKISPVTGKTAYAFAKTDQEFLALQDHPNTAVQTLVMARLGEKSTLAESRAQRLINISNLQWPVTQQGNLPVPLYFSGAHTHRMSGAWKLNLQNLPTRGGKNELRRALTAPKGYVVMTCDASQIQARLAAWLCGQHDLVQQFENKDDVYSIFASEVFGRPITKADKAERFCGKTSILSLQFGVAWLKLQNSIAVQSLEQVGIKIELPDEVAVKIVDTYRNKNYAIKNTWNVFRDTGIPVLAYGGDYRIGPCIFEKHRINLPSGLALHYHNLHYTGNEWVFTYGGETKRIYGGKLLENIAQALERVLVMEAAARIQNRADAPCRMKLALQGHDELVYVIPEEQLDACRAIAEEEMRRRPDWGPDLPLDAESGWGYNYGDAK